MKYIITLAFQNGNSIQFSILSHIGLTVQSLKQNNTNYIVKILNIYIMLSCTHLILLSSIFIIPEKSAMKLIAYLIILLLLSMGLISVYLVRFIVKYIQGKALLQITLVDLIYCDIIRWVLLCTLIFMSGVVGCHMDSSGR